MKLNFREKHMQMIAIHLQRYQLQSRSGEKLQFQSNFYLWDIRIQTFHTLSVIKIKRKNIPLPNVESVKRNYPFKWEFWSIYKNLKDALF